jgi:hypothetical protein
MQVYFCMENVGFQALKMEELAVGKRENGTG